MLIIYFLIKIKDSLNLIQIILIFFQLMMQFFSFNSNNLPFEKSKAKLNNNTIKEPYY